jgi:hypothetical protein
MSRGRVVICAILGALAFGLGARPAHAAAPAPIPRPTSGGTYAYATPEAAPYVAARAVVHYVTTGVDAPPLNDDDGDGIPDYVEEVGAAADKALQYYQGAGFKAPLPDTGGPDAKPDIYIHALPPGLLGLTFAQEFAVGGTFVLISPRLDPAQPKAFGSLSVTVAHELAHVVQFSYVVKGTFPTWAAEGSAAALSMLVFPQIQDTVEQEYLDGWLAQPWLSLYDERSGCAHCYGGAWWWSYLMSLKGGVVPRYFAALQADAVKGRSTAVGISELDAALRQSGAGTLDSVFRKFSLNLYDRGLPLGAPYSLSASTKPRTTRVFNVLGLSAQYVPVHVPATARGVVIAVPYGAGPRPDMTLVVGGPHGRRIVGKRFRPGRGFVFSTVFRNARERKHVVLVLTSGHVTSVPYQLGYASVPPGRKLPAWIAFSS